MNGHEKNISYEDHVGWALGKSEYYQQIMGVSRSNHCLIMKYDLTKKVGEEFVGVTPDKLVEISDTNLSADRFHKLSFDIGRSLTESEVKYLKSNFDPEISNYREELNSTDFFAEAEYIGELDERVHYLHLVFGLLLRELESERPDVWLQYRSAYDLYHERNATLKLLDLKRMNDSDILKFAIEETFTNGVLFHPSEIKDAICEYRDSLTS